VSAYSEEEFAPTTFKLGAVGYLTKTSLANEVVMAIRKVLAGGKYVSVELAEKWASALTGAPPQERHELLSHRELEVLRLLAIGKSIKEIAAAFSLSEKTIATYRARIVGKLGLSTNAELARYSLQHHLVE
jgi:DNA-binding NarL/FixJ family response regulator